MKILFITLEQSGRQIVKSILDDNFFKINKNLIFTFGMDEGKLEFNDLTNIKITPIMGFVDIVCNIKYLFNLRLKIKEIVDMYSFTHIFFVDSFDFSKFYIQKFKSDSFDKIGSISEEVTSNILKEIFGEDVNKSSIKAAVNETIKLSNIKKI